MMKKLLFIAFLLGNFIVLLSQSNYINNNSFEGYPGQSGCPNDWFCCNSLSTPDTQPCCWDVSIAASDKVCYVGLCMRGSEGQNIPKNEGIQTQLLKPLTLGNTYNLTIDLAAALNAYDDYVKMKNPSQLRILGGSESCVTTEIFVVSNLITSTNWESYTFNITPKVSDCKYLTLEIYSDTLKAAYLLLDNINIEYIEPVINIPNAFSPNGDGVNDVFFIRGLVDNMKMKVCDRFGKVVYETINYQNNWDGSDLKGEKLQTETYWYIITMPVTNKEYKGFVYIKQ